MKKGEETESDSEDYSNNEYNFDINLIKLKPDYRRRRRNFSSEAYGKINFRQPNFNMPKNTLSGPNSFYLARYRPFLLFDPNAQKLTFRAQFFLFGEIWTFSSFLPQTPKNPLSGPNSFYLVRYGLFLLFDLKR